MTTSPAGLTIRPGTARDVPTIVRLIRGLAEYERLLHEVRISPARVRRDGFGARRYFRTLLARRDGRAIGFALYFFTYSTFLARPTLYLEDLFVDPPLRNTGAGRALIEAVYREADARGCTRTYWVTEEGNATARALYDKLATKAPFVQYRR